MYKMKSRKGQTVSGLSDGALALGVLILVVVIVATLVGTVRDTQTVGTTEYNLSNDGLTGLDQYGSWFAIIVLVLIGSVIILLLRRSFAGATA